jgi:predicted O-methyltransferase YrrM
LPLVKQYVHSQLPPGHVPTILEIGVDRGVTMLPLVVFLARTRQEFVFVGVDVMRQEAVQVMLSHLDLQEAQRVFYVEENSLSFLPKTQMSGMKFDVVLLDGDHNYHTVSAEMKHLEELTNPGAIVICDDYDGRWAERDLWYAERPGYEDNKVATVKVETEKHGVKTAVDEWLDAHPTWQKLQPIQGEPVLLMRKQT